MLLDIHSPKSRAIFTAARHLDALHVIWQSHEPIPHEDAMRHVEALKVIAAEHFAESSNISAWIVQFSELFSLSRESREGAKQIYDDLVSKLDSAQGFETVFI